MVLLPLSWTCLSKNLKTLFGENSKAIAISVTIISKLGIMGKNLAAGCCLRPTFISHSSRVSVLAIPKVFFKEIWTLKPAIVNRSINLWSGNGLILDLASKLLVCDV